MGDDAGRCMTHDLWASLNQKMIEYLDSISLKKLVDDQLAKGVSIEEAPIKRAICPCQWSSRSRSRRRILSSRWAVPCPSEDGIPRSPRRPSLGASPQGRSPYSLAPSP